MNDNENNDSGSDERKLPSTHCPVKCYTSSASESSDDIHENTKEIAVNFPPSLSLHRTDHIVAAAAAPITNTPDSTTSFPVRLHQVLQVTERSGLDHIVAWRPHGRCFGVNKINEFVDCILPL